MSDLRKQFPVDDVVPFADDMPEETAYALPYDFVISLAKEKYTFEQAMRRFPELFQIRNCRATEAMFQTATHWCVRCQKK
jgi:hypothetical protein